MQKSHYLILVFILLLASGCAPQSTEVPAATVVAASTATLTIQPFPTPTQTPAATEILLTPTLDVAKILTYTAEPYSECPKANENLRFPKIGKKGDSFIKDDEIKKDTIDFLNTGGTLKAVYDGLTKLDPNAKVFTIDVTNDKVPDLTFKIGLSLFVLKCNHGKYEAAFERTFGSGEQLSSFELMYIKDINLNSVPEIIIKENAEVSNFDASFGCFGYYIYEWDGNQFKDLVSPEEVSFDSKIDIRKNTSKAYPSNGIFSCGTFVSVDETTHNKFEIKDTNQDGLAEIIIVSGVHVPEQFLGVLYSSPERQAILTLSWNGQFYVPTKIEYKSVYRIHVALDGDNAFKDGNYEQAMNLYQAAIENTKLIDQPLPAQSDIGMPDFIGGYKQVAAYAYYRSMLTRIAQSQTDDAKLIYEKIQNKFSKDETTKSFGEMTTEFWNEYQKSNDPANSCKKVGDYIKAHQEILHLFDLPNQNAYTAADVCPFR